MMYKTSVNIFFLYKIETLHNASIYSEHITLGFPTLHRFRLLRIEKTISIGSQITQLANYAIFVVFERQPYFFPIPYTPDRKCVEMKISVSN